jgi:hypothetical protein
MRELLRRQEGSAFLSAVVLVGVMIMLGLAVHASADNEARQSGQERVRESALGVSEAALQAQVFQLAGRFPQTAAGAYPAACAPGAGGVGCPDPNAFQGFSGGDYAATCNGAAVTRWTTQVRDNVNALAHYDAGVVNSNPRWDSNGDGIVWIRADGRSGCRTRSIVTQVKVGVQQLHFPRNVVTANAFSTANKGRKVIIDTRGNAGQPADVSLRCSGFANPTTCAVYERNKGQLSPDTLQAPSASPDPLLDGDALESVKAQARALGTYFPAGTCPPTLTGKVVYVEDLTPCGGSRAGNSAASPGFLVVGRGTFSIGGNSIFHGVVYMRNQQQTNGVVVSITGTAAIHGALAVDGLGRVTAGSSKAGIVYDSRAPSLVTGLGMAAAVPNTWRELNAGL